MENPVPTQRRRRPKEVAEGPGNRYFSKAIGRALDVLECFTDGETALSLKEIHRKIELPESSLFRILLTLEARGYLKQKEDGAYKLARRILYGKAREDAERLRVLARSHLEALAARFNETASLAYLFEDRIQVLDAVETLHEVRVTNRPGRVLPPHCSSMGKAITAFQPPEKISRILEVYGFIRRTPKTVLDRAALVAEYGRIREIGVAFDREEATEGGFCIGVPVRWDERPVAAAISLSMPLARAGSERQAAMIAALAETAAAVAAR